MPAPSSAVLARRYEDFTSLALPAPPPVDWRTRADETLIPGDCEAFTADHCARVGPERHVIVALSTGTTSGLRGSTGRIADAVCNVVVSAAGATSARPPALVLNELEVELVPSGDGKWTFPATLERPLCLTAAAYAAEGVRVDVPAGGSAEVRWTGIYALGSLRDAFVLAEGHMDWGGGWSATVCGGRIAMYWPGCGLRPLTTAGGRFPRLELQTGPPPEAVARASRTVGQRLCAWSAVY